ncbi:hypothetical protein K435DRAFT_713400 [Dendrothele bispora CBS 962.96]|uniref:Uncharacterized protein n=1 Tax=Dendrothele bispora (strain CBS 962.96) TaxID=1314807 RepID=A0A4S8MQS7_DENBC|nr:hypothetical protein K435DRAFT_713400 [Dendrothele bispora CBS 962.96]
MSEFSDLSDRLSRHAREIKKNALAIQSSTPGPFARAVLSTELGDLIRDADPSEIGLFTITRGSSKTLSHDKEAQNASGNVQISRVEFHGATPLRKSMTRKERGKESQPEDLAKAALKYIDKYPQVNFKPRTQARLEDIIDAVDETRHNIQELNENLRQAEIAEAPSVKGMLDEEELRIRELKVQIAEYKKKKEILTAKKARMRLPSPTKKMAVESARKTPLSEVDRADRAEDEFWNTPSNKARTFHLNDNLLMDEEAEFGDTSIASLASPIPTSRSGFASQFDEDRQGAPSPPPPESPTQRIRVPPRSQMPTQDAVLPPPKKQEAHLDEKTPVPETDIAQEPKKTKPHINVETERIVVKMWSTVGEILMPGNNFGVAPGKPPEAKATLSHLNYLSSLTPSPASPIQSSSSVSAATRANAPPTAQQILTATMLFTLLTAPNHSLPLNKVKEVLTAKASTSGSAAMVSSHSRILYGCVAKRLLKIERGSGEQIVKFDI